MGGGYGNFLMSLEGGKIIFELTREWKRKHVSPKI